MITEPVGFTIFLVCCLSYLGLTGLLLRGRAAGGPGNWLILSTLVMAGWAAVGTVVYASPGLLPRTVAPAADVLRSVVWVALLGRFLYGMRQQEGESRRWLFGVLAMSGLAGTLLLLHYLTFIAPGLVEPLGQLVQVSGSSLSHLVLAVCGLSLVENLYRNTSATNRWGVQLLCLGLGGIFLFEVILYADALLFRFVDPQLMIARGAIAVMAVPLIAVSAARNPSWKLDVFVSRQMVFHTLSLIGAGAYLILMSAAGFYFREKGGDWGTLIQITFLFAAVLALLVVLLSGRFRAKMRVFLNKHFFNYNYDYREEWLKVLETISSLKDDMPLQSRVIKAVCDIVESPGGQLWLEAENDTYRPVNRWNFRSSGDGVEPKASPIVRKMAEHSWIVEFDQLNERGRSKTGLTAPIWSRDNPDYWIGVPLMHRKQMIGFLALERPRTARTLNWEDYDILRTAGEQVASYLAEESSASALAEAHQFDTFNRRFAFVMHDLKNLVSQLSLITRNAERHKDDPEFQQDMLDTVGESVRKMKMLLERMSDQSQKSVRVEDFELNDLLRRLAGDMATGSGRLELALVDGGIWLAGEKEKVESVFRHLIQNGLDALADVERQGVVKVATSIDDGRAVIRISDNGCGMDVDFIREQLFAPFRSTKQSGYGIGAFESRQIVLEHGGRLDVTSEPGRGTTFTVGLPLSKRSMEQSGASMTAEAV